MVSSTPSITQGTPREPTDTLLATLFLSLIEDYSQYVLEIMR